MREGREDGGYTTKVAQSTNQFQLHEQRGAFPLHIHISAFLNLQLQREREGSTEIYSPYTSPSSYIKHILWIGTDRCEMELIVECYRPASSPSQYYLIKQFPRGLRVSIPFLNVLGALRQPKGASRLAKCTIKGIKCSGNLHTTFCSACLITSQLAALDMGRGEGEGGEQTEAV